MIENYEKLANAVVLQAVKDYRKVLRTALRYPQNRSAKAACRKIERFFRSDWFEVLTQINPERLIAQLKAEVSA